MDTRCSVEAPRGADEGQEGEMANVELVLAFERRLELVPVRRGWWVTTQTVATRGHDTHPWGRIIGELPKEGVMHGGEGVA
jgi:hypothetical protein